MVQCCPPQIDTANISLMLILGHSTRRGLGRSAHAALAQLKTQNTYLDFKIHVLQKLLVHCLCKFVDGSQEDPKKEQQ